MKFVCDNCKAKYQIGDDKVAGKTVRMKCRKCGYNIKVSPGGMPDAPSVDMPSHEVEAPASLPGHAGGHAPAPAAPRAPAPAPAPIIQAPGHSGGHPQTPGHSGGHPAPAARATWNEADDESTSIMSMPVRDAVAAATGRDPQPRPPAPRPLAGERPAAPHPPRPVTAAAPPRPYNPPGRTVPGVGHAGGAGPARPVTRASGASMAAVQHEHTPHATPLAALHTAPEVEWYVGIGGTPIGPVRVSVIRERALAHEVDGESLVWREGQSEWRPLRTVPELLEVITAALAPRPAPTPTPFVAVASAPAPAPAPAPTPAPLAAAAAPAAPAPVAAAPAAAPVVVSDPVAARGGLGEPAAPPAASPFVGGPLATPTNGKANGFHHANGVDAAVIAPTAGAPHTAGAAKPSSVDIDPALEEKLVPRRSNTHPMAYAFIAAAMAFAGVAAYVLLVRPPAQPQVIYVTAPGATVTGAATTSAAADDKGQPQVEVGELTTAGSGRPVARLGGPMPKASTAPTSTSVAAPIDTSGFVANVPGPKDTGPSGPAPGGGQLSAGEIQGVVSQNQALVKRKCWQPALEARSANAPMTARVNGSITIGASGAVESASANGAEKDYPTLSSCIAARMKNWKFPASGGSQQVNVPFVFAGQ